MHCLITCVVIFSSRQYRHPQETPNCRGVFRMHLINPSINLRTDWTCAPEDACNVHITRANQGRGFELHACINQSINLHDMMMLCLWKRVIVEKVWYPSILYYYSMRGLCSIYGLLDVVGRRRFDSSRVDDDDMICFMCVLLVFLGVCRVGHGESWSVVRVMSWVTTSFIFLFHLFVSRFKVSFRSV